MLGLSTSKQMDRLSCQLRLRRRAPANYLVRKLLVISGLRVTIACKVLTLNGFF